uniref:RxLR effector candidate protein n=1 Tax=Hyaloperonospora arabidopsidis (strain Emoy2) TaxID=559515 RepID=M4BQ01_HYAAE|nr:RxLR effector candidate protein [Hyaloperonospora arabidopsidis Emoy2]
MRVHCLVFLASSALSARGDGVLEPADPDVAAPYSSSVARSLTENDNDNVPATMSFKSEGPVNDDERIMTGVSSLVGKVQERIHTAVQGEKQKTFNFLAQSRTESNTQTFIENALKTKEWKALSVRYERSGGSMITPLLARYDCAEVARVLAPALKFNKDGVLQLPKKPASVKEKLAVDMLKHWGEEKRPIRTLFTDLELNVQTETSPLYYNLGGSRMRVLEAYRQYAKIDDQSYLDAVKTGFGGKTIFLEHLGNAKTFWNTADKADELEKIALNTPSLNPLDVLKKTKPNSLRELIFDTDTFRLVSKYVEANPARKTTVLKVMMDSLGGEAHLLQALADFRGKPTDAWLSCRLALFNQWRTTDKVTSTSGLQDRLNSLSDAKQKRRITRMYTAFFEGHQ